MPLDMTGESRQNLTLALRLMTEALDILDASHAPGEIGSILDLAIVRLGETLVQGATPDAQTLLVELKREFTIVDAEVGHKPSPWDVRADDALPQDEMSVKTSAANDILTKLP